MRARIALLGLAILLLPFDFLSAQAPAGPRFALVIGNSNYVGMPRLRNPANDAGDLAAALKRLGFNVTLLTDARRRTMNQAIVAFRESLAQDRQSEGIFFFAGHGIQSKGVNYLIPVGADIRAEVDLDDEAVSAQKILGSLEEARNRVNLVILDACRDNPLPGALRSAARGLAVVTSAPAETLILYSTAAGQTAADGEGRNSPFARALLDHVADTGDVTRTVKVITGEVKKTTGGQQTPYVYMGLSVDFSLNPARGGSSAAAPEAALAKKPVFTVEKAYGSVTVAVRTQGTLFLNGAPMGQVGPQSSARLDDIEAGKMTLEMHYANGTAETRAIEVTKNSVIPVSFTYVEKVKLPEDMVLVDGGAFRMGNTFGNGNADERPVHSVIISSFYLGKYEVTQKQWREVMGSAPPRYSGGDMPVEAVSWYDAVQYCNRLSSKNGLNPCYSINGTDVTCDFTKNGFRLPTEAEWEYAARGGARSQGYQFSGGNEIDAVAWYSANSRGKLNPVGGKRPNELGLFDMTGNLWEWCWDWHGSYPAAPQGDPQGPPSGDGRIARGSSGQSVDGLSVRNTSVCLRSARQPAAGLDWVGFRVAARAP